MAALTSACAASVPDDRDTWLIPTSVRHAYFPSDRPSVSDEFPADLSAAHLARMQEPQLWAPLDSTVEVYRFLWLRSFDHPVAVRVWYRDDEVFLKYKVLSGATGYGNATILDQGSRRLAPIEWTALLEAITEAQFWIGIPDWRDGIDGAEWVLEGFKPDVGYRAVARWSPRPTGESLAYFNAGVAFLELAGVFAAEPIY